MNAIQQAHGLRIDAELALIASRNAREGYIQGLRSKVNDDELRHLHYGAMDAAVAAGNAQHVLLGQRSYQYVD